MVGWLETVIKEPPEFNTGGFLDDVTHYISYQKRTQHVDGWTNKEPAEHVTHYKSHIRHKKRTHKTCKVGSGTPPPNLLDGQTKLAHI
jgi:hypothetical protein